jgi:hypothetical protein
MVFEFKVDDTYLLEDIDYMSEKFKDLASFLDTRLNDGRPKSIAKTYLETAWLWSMQSLMDEKNNADT